MGSVYNYQRFEDWEKSSRIQLEGAGLSPNEATNRVEETLGAAIRSRDAIITAIGEVAWRGSFAYTPSFETNAREQYIKLLVTLGLTPSIFDQPNQAECYALDREYRKWKNKNSR
jgi:hypothetical protein